MQHIFSIDVSAVLQGFAANKRLSNGGGVLTWNGPHSHVVSLYFTKCANYATLN